MIGLPKIFGSAVYSLAAILLLLALSWGCEPLHRDIETPWDGDVGSPEDDAGDNRDDISENHDPEQTNDPEGQECEPGASCGPCDQGQITCTDDGEPLCEGAVDLQSDLAHCGQCNHQCLAEGDDLASLECQQGECVAQCEDEALTFCETASSCVDLQSNRNHCGVCDSSCAGNQVCCEGTCTGQGSGC